MSDPSLNFWVMPVLNQILNAVSMKLLAQLCSGKAIFVLWTTDMEAYP